MEKLDSEIVLNSVHPYLMPFRVTKKDACALLSIGIDKLNSMVESDPSFPKPLNEGTGRQAAVYFDYQDLLSWYSNWKQSRPEKTEEAKRKVKVPKVTFS